MVAHILDLGVLNGGSEWSYSHPNHFIFLIYCVFNDVVSRSYCTASRPALGFTQPPLQLILGAPCRVKQVGCIKPPSNAEVKNGGAICPLPYTSSWCGTVPVSYCQ
jgi:hypothetical protein